MGYVLGLDLGPTSIGWAALELNENGEPFQIATVTDKDETGETQIRIPAIGARLFPAGVEKLNQGKQEEPKNKTRREKRSIRRRLRRAKARRMGLIDLLIEKGLVANREAIQALQKRDPYEIRAEAIERKIELEEIARIFLHFAKRRGFKSNRRQPESQDAKATEMKLAKERLAKELNGRTLGAFWNDVKAKPSEVPLNAIRNRKGRYQWVAQREQYQDELARIWKIQSAFYPNVLTKDFYDKLSLLLFRQIPFELTTRKKKKIIGACELLAGKPRCPWADRKAQKFRYLQKINDLRVNERPLTIEERQKLADALALRKELRFDDIRKLLWGEAGDDRRFNLEYKTNDKIIGHVIDSILTGPSFFDKKAWLRLDDEQKDSVWKILREFLAENIAKQNVEEQLFEKYGLRFKKDNWTEKLTEPRGYCSYSREALEKILPGLEAGKSLYDAIRDAFSTKGRKESRLLPLPVKENGYSIPNPVVGSMLFQLRKVVNLLIKEKGLPEKIVIETTREIKAGKERRQEIIREQDANQKEREKTKAAIRDMMGWSDEVDISGTDILKYRLWKRQNEFCPFRCSKIPPTILFTRETDLAHILPREMSFDNSMENLVVCYAKENQDMGMNTPISWLGEGSERWETLCDAQRRNAFGFSAEKWERFCTRNEEIAEKYLNRRLLQDTAYIARAVRDYLKSLYPAQDAEQKVRTTKGGVTAELRNLWGLNSILRDGESGPKNRADLRHHAIDAVVVALTNPGQIQRITKKLQQNWPRRSRYAEIAGPWEGFEQDLANAVEQINVSHRVQRKIKGALHGETNYALEKHGKNKGKYITRKSLSDLTIPLAEKICDPTIREMVLRRFAEYDNDPKAAFEKPLYLPNHIQPDKPMPIRSVRVWKTSRTMLPLNDTVWVEPDNNHHVEIFIERGRDSKCICKVCSMWEAAQRIKNKQPIIAKKHPKNEKAEFFMSLSKGETVFMKGKSGQVGLVRIIGISGDPEDPTKIDIEAKPIHLADVKLEKEAKNALRKEWRIHTLKRFDRVVLRKVTIDPLGRIRRAND